MYKVYVCTRLCRKNCALIVPGGRFQGYIMYINGKSLLACVVAMEIYVEGNSSWANPEWCLPSCLETEIVQERKKLSWTWCLV